MKILPLNYNNIYYNNKVQPQYSYNKFELQNDSFEKLPSFNGKVLKSEINTARKTFYKFLSKNNPINEKLLEINAKYVNAQNSIAKAKQGLRETADEIYRNSYITALFGDYKKCFVSKRGSGAHEAYKQIIEIYDGMSEGSKAEFADDITSLKTLFSIQDDVTFESKVQSSLKALRNNLDESLEKFSIDKKAGNAFINDEKLINLGESKSRKLIEGIYYPEKDINEFLANCEKNDFDFHSARDDINKKITYYLTYRDLINEFIKSDKKGVSIYKNQVHLDKTYKLCENNIVDSAKPYVKDAAKSTIRYHADTFSRKVLNLLENQENSLMELTQRFKNSGIEISEDLANYSASVIK